MLHCSSTRKSVEKIKPEKITQNNLSLALLLFDLVYSLCSGDRLGGLVVKASASRAEDPGSNPSCVRIFPG